MQGNVIIKNLAIVHTFIAFLEMSMARTIGQACQTHTSSVSIPVLLSPNLHSCDWFYFHCLSLLLDCVMSINSTVYWSWEGTISAINMTLSKSNWRRLMTTSSRAPRILRPLLPFYTMLTWWINLMPMPMYLPNHQNFQPLLTLPPKMWWWYLGVVVLIQTFQQVRLDPNVLVSTAPPPLDIVNSHAVQQSIYLAYVFGSDGLDTNVIVCKTPAVLPSGETQHSEFLCTAERYCVAIADDPTLRPFYSDINPVNVRSRVLCENPTFTDRFSHDYYNSKG